MLQTLPVRGWSVEAEPVLRCGLAATKLHVRDGDDDTVVRTASHISGLVEEARLPDRVRERSLAVFAALADAEGRLHRRPAEQVHFHEVGGIDAIADVVGPCIAPELPGVAEVPAPTVTTGTGMVRACPGLLPKHGSTLFEKYVW